MSLLAEFQRKFSKEEDLKETLSEISSLEKCKMEDDSEAHDEEEDDSQGNDVDDEEGEQLIEEEMALSDRGICGTMLYRIHCV